MPAQVQNQPFSKEPWFCFMDNGIRSQDLGPKCVYYVWGVISSKLSGQNEEVCVHILTHLYTHIYKYFYM